MRKALIAAAALVVAGAVAGLAGLVLFVAVFIPPPAAAAAGSGTSTLKPGKVPAQYEQLVNEAGSLCPALSPPILAVQLDVESSFDPNAVSPAGAVGVAQFLPSTWATYGIDGNEDGVADIHDPVDAIWSAAGYDCALAAEVGAGADSRKMLAAYNAGPGNLRAGLGYADQILATAKSWSQPVGGVNVAGLPAPSAAGCARPTGVGVPTSPFGMRWGRLHAGQDIGVPVGTPVGPACPGVVAFAGPSAGYGNYVCVQHPGGVATCYGHLSQILVRVGDPAPVGKPIALSGNTGHSTGPHLHFEVRRPGVWGTPEDPVPWLAGLGIRY